MTQRFSPACSYRDGLSCDNGLRLVCPHPSHHICAPQDKRRLLHVKARSAAFIKLCCYQYDSEKGKVLVMNTKETALMAVNALEDKKAEDIRIIDISDISTIIHLSVRGSQIGKRVCQYFFHGTVQILISESSRLRQIHAWVGAGSDLRESPTQRDSSRAHLSLCSAFVRVQCNLQYRPFSPACSYRDGLSCELIQPLHWQWPTLKIWKKP